MAKAKSAPAARPRRASQRVVICIDLAEESLRALMIEQCKSDRGGYITAYCGSRTELVAAGIPEMAFPSDGAVAAFQVQTLNACCTGSHEILSGSMRSISPAGFELEIDWGFVRPYVQCSHPAVGELARMLLKDVDAWTRTAYGNGKGPDIPDLAHPIDMLAADERAEYKPLPGAPRLQVTAEFHKKLSNYASYLYESVYTDCEVLPIPGKAVAPSPRPSFLRLAVDNDSA
jgi:hypothetical protein